MPGMMKAKRQPRYWPTMPVTSADERDAEIAPDAVQPHLAAEPVGIGHDHRGADGMIDRREQPIDSNAAAELEPCLPTRPTAIIEAPMPTKKITIMWRRLQRSPLTSLSTASRAEGDEARGGVRANSSE